jgi:hypothetical protein
VGISQHPGLASRLSEVIIGSQKLVAIPELISSRIQNGYVNRGMLLQTGLARDLLAQAFSKLPNLTKVGLRDYDGDGRTRDGQNARWRSWGWSLCSPVRHTHASAPDAMFPVILSALAHANSLPTNVEVFLRHSAQLIPE